MRHFELLRDKYRLIKVKMHKKIIIDSVIEGIDIKYKHNYRIS